MSKVIGIIVFSLMTSHPGSMDDSLYLHHPTEDTAVVQTIEETMEEIEMPTTISYTTDELTVELPTERYLGTFEATAYCSCYYCCGNTSGITASGTVVQEGRTIAVDPNIIPLGSKVKVIFSNGTEHTYIAEDTGGAVKGNILDIYMGSHDACSQIGRQYVEVYLVED